MGGAGTEGLWGLGDWGCFRFRRAIALTTGHSVPCSNTFMNLGRFELCLQVSDISLSLDFYTKLDFHLIDGSVEEGVVVIRNGDCRIGLYQGHITENLLNFRGGDIAEIGRQAETLGLKFEKPPFSASDGSMGALLRDPDGNAVYLVSHPGESGA